MDYEATQGPVMDVDRYLSPNGEPVFAEISGMGMLGIVKIDTEHFTFSQDKFNSGTKELRDKLCINKNIRKYFVKRFFLFERFDNGILLDEESWYSVVGQPISRWLRRRLLDSKIRLDCVFEPFCGVGGVAVHLSCIAHRYLVNDLDSIKIEMLKNNLAVYGVDQSNIQFNAEDFMKIQPFKCDLVILCPPWGGTNLGLYEVADIDTLMNPPLSHILAHAATFSRNMILQMPKNTNIGHLLRTIAAAGIAPVAQIVRIMLNEVNSQLMIFLGEQNLTKMSNGMLYTMLYRRMGCQSKQDNEQVKKEYRSNPLSVMSKAYLAAKAKNPNDIQ